MSARRRLLTVVLLVAFSAGWHSAGAQTSSSPAGPSEQELQRAAERGSVRALLQLAALRVKAGDGEAAAAALRRAIAIAPNSEEVLTAYAHTALARRDYSQAALALEPLLRMHPTVAEYPYLLGVAWMELGDMTSAVTALQRAAELEPHRVLTLAALGLAWNEQKRFDLAKGTLDEALLLSPDDPNVLAALAEAEAGLGDTTAAERYADQALARAPKNANALLVIGLLRMRQQRYAEARQALESAVAVIPNSSRMQFQLSQACDRLGDVQCAEHHRELYRRALREVEERLKALHLRSIDSGETSP